MKFLHILIFGGTMAFTSLAHANTSFDAGQFGHMKGVLDVCSRVYLRESSAYFLEMKAMIGDATKEMVNEAAATGEYQQAYQHVLAELSSMTPEEMAQACTAYLSPPSRTN